MPLGEARQNFAFLYQTDEGVIDARLWRRSAAPLAAIFLALSTVWLLVRPYAARSLTQRSFFDSVTIAANVYLLIYGLAAILLAISWVNLAAKRFRDRERIAPLGLAGMLPLAALFDGALRWLQPQITDVLPRWSVFVGDGIVFLVLVWTIAACGGPWSKAKSTA